MKPVSKSQIAWIILGASALCLAGLALFSIYRENAGNAQRRADLVEQQQRRLTEKLASYFYEIQLQTARQLIGYHQEGLATQLERWTKTDPLIREAQVSPPQTEIEPYLQNRVSELISLESPDAPSLLRNGYYQDNKEIALHDEVSIDPVLFWSYQDSPQKSSWIVGHRIAKGQPLRTATLDTDILINAFQALIDELAVPDLSVKIITSNRTDPSTLNTILPDHSLQLSFTSAASRFWSESFSYSIVILTLAIGGLCSYLIARQVSSERRDALRKTTFVSQISHEFKTPLTSISLYSELLANEALAPAKRQKYLDTISRESLRLSEMVDNILALNALEMGKKKYRIQSLDLPEIIESILSDYQPSLSASNLHVEWVPPSLSSPVLFDPAALRQILLNLFDNARKYAAAGKLIRLRLESTERSRLIIEDLGPGIPPSLRDQIFEAFFQKESTLIDKSPGAGIGLSISRRMARDCQGELSLDPTYTLGARFILDFPSAT